MATTLDPGGERALALVGLLAGTEQKAGLKLVRELEARFGALESWWSRRAEVLTPEVAPGLGALCGGNVDREAAAEALADRRFAARVDASTAEAQQAGIHAIPAFVLDRRLLLLGAQPHEVFARALEQVEASSKP